MGKGRKREGIQNITSVNGIINITGMRIPVCDMSNHRNAIPYEHIIYY